MILSFPDLDTLRLAITSGAVPPAVSRAAATAGTDAGRLLVRPSVPAPGEAVDGLRRMGVPSIPEDGQTLSESVACWAEFLPLQKAGGPPVTDRTAVLFDLPGGEQFADVVGEILRLGNDRQSFRWLDGDGGRRALLRVLGPPYYSLLRAVDRDGPHSPRAFVERAPHVWVEVGYDHPLSALIQAPAGKLVLIQWPRTWTYLDDAPFRDIYDIVELTLPDVPAAFRDADLSRRLTVPVRLAAASSTEPAELWVVRDRPMGQLDALVQNASDQLLARFSFAAAAGEECVVLRVRPSRSPPPVLVLDAVGYRPYQKLPNLFLPCGTRLHPPLRRDAVRKLLADDPARVTWLAPHGDGRFTPQSLPDAAFRPLDQWVDYVLDRDAEALTAWVQSARFEFEPFVCEDDRPERPTKPAVAAEDPAPAETPADTGTEPDTGQPPQAINEQPATPEEENAEEAPRAESTEWQKRLRELEQLFLNLESPLDDPARRELWRAMADANAAVGNAPDASICWANTLWEEETPPPLWLKQWRAAEDAARQGADLLSGPELDRLLAGRQPTAADVRALAAAVAWAAGGGTSTLVAPLLERLDQVHRFLERHEGILPARTAWLAWVGLVKLSRGDVLALARARDRLLERLYRQGLSPDLDLPGFLHFSGQSAGDRLRAVGDRVLHLRDLARQWIKGEKTTEAYVDLSFAYGLARLGKNSEGERLLAIARDMLGGRDHVHKFLLRAYESRVRQALDGKPHAGPLPADLMAELASWGNTSHDERMARYVVDKLREKSRILEPHVKIDPYRNWHGHFLDDLSRELAGLFDVNDRAELTTRLGRLLQSGPRRGAPKDAPARIVETALELAPRLGEAFGRDVLRRAEARFDAWEGPPERAAQFLEKALFLAAHFDQAESVKAFVERFRQLLGSLAGTPAVRHLDAVVGQCFRGLRKLGLRDAVDRLLQETTELVLQGRDVEGLGRQLLADAKCGKSVSHWPPVLYTLLHVAAGWYYFGRDERGRPALDLARSVLFRGCFAGAVHQTRLARAYIGTLNQIRVEEALRRIEELFRKLDGVGDLYTTNSHYALSRLEVVEAAVLAVVDDDFALGGGSRRWRDEDEYLVRRRIHRDLKALLAGAGL